MMCENCGQREATIHEVTIRSGKARERHLCEQCAGQAGLAGGLEGGLITPGGVGPGLVGPGFSGAGAGSSGKALAGPAALAAGMVPTGGAGVAGGAAAGAAGRGDAALGACGRCGLTYAAFKQTGLLGCPGCYAAFEERLGPLLERAHEGATHHVGKVPRRALAECRAEGGGEGAAGLLGGEAERAERIETVRKQLRRAVESEQYELAARLRDELDGLLSRRSFGAGPAGGAGPVAGAGGQP